MTSTKEKQRSIMAMANFQFSSNSIISTTDYDSQTGGQVDYLCHVNGVWNGNLMGDDKLPVKEQELVFHVDGFVQIFQYRWL